MSKEETLCLHVYYTKAKNIAMNNGEEFHLAAVLLRNRKVVRFGTNSKKTHPKFQRRYRNGEIGSHLHAEMDVIRFAKPGDTLIVFRFLADGSTSMSKPCEICQKFIKASGVKKVFHTNWEGEIVRMRL